MTELGYDVHIVSRHSNLNQPKVTAHCCDILDPMKSTQLLDKVRPSHLLHLAWCTEPKTFWNTSDNLRWFSASTHLFSSFVKFGGHRIVGCGSCAEYEWVDGRVCHERSTPTRPASNYGRAKLSTGNWLDTFATANGISAAWPRIFYLFGPWGHEQRMPGVHYRRTSRQSAGEVLKWNASSRLHLHHRCSDSVGNFAGEPG